VSATPNALRPLLAVVRGLAPTCRLRGRYAPLRGGNAAMRGQCENAAAVFHLLAGGTGAGWRMMRIGGDVWPLGPHYFVRHVSGTVVDPTADQFPPGTRVPYELARGQSAGGFRRVPAGARVGRVSLAGQTATPEALRAALRADPAEASAAAGDARRWSYDALGGEGEGAPGPAARRRKRNAARPPKGTPTHTNLFALREAFTVDGELASRVPNSLRPSSLPHLRRCLAAGLVRVEGRELALTDAGVAALAAFRWP